MTSVLVVEDDALLAYALAGNLRDVGYRVVGPAPNLAAANRLLAENKIDIACLDVRLGERETSVPLAHNLAALGIPFLFLTAYTIAHMPLDMRDRPMLDKPFKPEVLVACIAALVEASAATHLGLSDEGCREAIHSPRLTLRTNLPSSPSGRIWG